MSRTPSSSSFVLGLLLENRMMGSFAQSTGPAVAVPSPWGAIPKVGLTIRMPTSSVSIVELAFVAKRATTVDEVNTAARQAAETDLKGILEYSKGELVSVDFNHNASSSIFDATLTKVSEGTLVKLSSWYDNAWGFSNRMLDTTVAFVKAAAAPAKSAA